MPKQTKINKTLSNETINKYLKFTNAALQYAVDNEVLKKNPMNKVKLFPINRAEAKILNTEDAQILLQAARDEEIVTIYGKFKGLYYPIILTALVTGIRQGELIALRWKNVDLERGYIKIVENYTKGVLTTVKTSSSNRIVNIPSFLVEVLKEHRKTLSNNPLGLVFPTLAGTYQSGRNLTDRVLKRLLKRANLPRVTWHQLRHSCISALAQEQVSPTYIQRQAGHSNLRTTINIYSHVTDSMNQQAMNALDNAFNINSNATELLQEGENHEKLQ